MVTSRTQGNAKTMTNSFPPDLTTYVQGAVSTGKYPSEHALVTAAVRLLKAKDEHEEWLRKEVQAGLNQLERGEYTDYDNDSLDDLFERIKSDGRKLLAARQGAQQ